MLNMNKHNIRAIKINNIGGYTLTEALVGGVLIAICALILVSGFLTAYSFLAKSTLLKDKGMLASSVIEGATNTELETNSISDVNLYFTIGEAQYASAGSFFIVYDPGLNVRFTEFISNLHE